MAGKAFQFLNIGPIHFINQLTLYLILFPL